MSCPSEVLSIHGAVATVLAIERSEQWPIELQQRRAWLLRSVKKGVGYLALLSLRTLNVCALRVIFLITIVNNRVSSSFNSTGKAGEHKKAFIDHHLFLRGFYVCKTMVGGR